MAVELSEEQQQQQQETSEATLKLTILSTEGIKDVRILGRMKCYAVAWIDPRRKACTKTLNCGNNPNPTWNQQLSFSISHQTLQDPDSHITIQVLSPFHNEKVIGSTVMSLTRIRLDDQEEVFTLQLWRPSGRAQGLLRVAARIEFHVNVGGGYYAPVGCFTGIPFGSNSLPLLGLDQGAAVESRVLPVHNNGLPLVLDRRFPVESGFVPVVPSAPPMPDRVVDARRSFLVGMLSGVVAALLIGSSVGG